MKESTGELHNTIVVVLAVGVLIAFFYFVIWPIIRESFNEISKCRDAICEKCEEPNNNCEFVKCHSKKNSDKNPGMEFECVYKG